MPPEDPHEPHRSSLDDLLALNEHERAGTPFMAWRADDRRLRFFTFGPEVERAAIGRDEAADVCIDWDPAVSSVHAELRRLASQWLISDDNISLNGTKVNGVRIGAGRQLRHADRIVVGNTMMVFHAPGRKGAGTIVVTDEPEDDLPIVRRDDLNGNELPVLIALCKPLLLGTSEEPPENEQIAKKVYLGEDGVRRVLTRLYKRFGITEQPKRRRLAQRAIALEVVRRTDA